MRAKDYNLPEESGDLELRIQGMLHPVQPDRIFIDQLHRRLTTSPRVEVERQTSLLGLILILGGLLTGVVSILIIRRIFDEPDDESAAQ